MRVFLLLLSSLLLFLVVGLTTMVHLTVVYADGVSLEDTDFKFPGNVPKLMTEDSDTPVSVVENILLNYVVRPIFFIAAGVTIFILLQAAFALVQSRAEEEKLTEAKKTITWSLLGLLLIIGAYTLTRNLIAFVLAYF